MSAPLLEVRGLGVRLGGRDLLRGVDLVLGPGEGLALLGDSGAGKSLTALGLFGLCRAPEGQLQGEVRWRDAEGPFPASDRRRLGRLAAYVPQDPLSALDPLRRVGSFLAAPLRKQGLSRRRSRDRVVELLELCGVEEAASRLGNHPHELSGGERQRVVLAGALVNAPRVLVADEPTSALDPVRARQFLDLLARLREEQGLALVLVTHDVRAARGLVGEGVWLRDGAVAARGDWAALEAAAGPALFPPRLRLSADATRLRPSEDPADEAPRLEARGLVVRHRLPRRRLLGRRPVRTALDGVGFRLRAGERVGVVGVSGAGKSTLARVLLRLERPDAGEVLWDGAAVGRFSERRLAPRRRAVQAVFQDPTASLDPRLPAARQIGDALGLHEGGDRTTRRGRARELLAEVGLDASFLDRRPRECSGGENQRVALARALALEPRVLVLDEALSSLDAPRRFRILESLDTLARARRLAVLLVTHDLEEVRAFCDRVLVLSEGRLVEEGAVEEVLRAPRSEAGRALVRAAAAAGAVVGRPPAPDG